MASALPEASRGLCGWNLRQEMGPILWELSREVCVLTTPLCSPDAFQSFTTCSSQENLAAADENNAKLIL